MIRRFVTDSLLYGTATIFSRATLLVALLVLPFILTPRDYGALSMLVAVAALVAIVAPLEIWQAVGRFYVPAPPEAKPAYLGTAWTVLLTGLFLFLLLSQLFAVPLCRLILGDLDFLPVFRVALVMMALNCLFYFLQHQCRWDFRTAEYVLISLVFAFLTLALSLGLGFLVDPPLLGVVLGQAIGAALAVALGWAGLRRRLVLRVDKTRLREMLSFSLPLVPAGIALFFTVYMGRLALKALATLEDVGLYTFAAQIAGIATLGIVGVQSALTPLVMAHHDEPGTPAQLARFFEWIFGCGLVLSLVLGLFAPELIWILGYSAYGGAGPLVILLAPAMLLLQMYVFAPGFTVARRTLWQMWVSVFSAFVGLVANVVLIPLWGITGAAVATLITGMVFIALWVVLSQRLYPLPIRWLPIAVATIGGALLGAVGLTLPYRHLAEALLVKSALVVAASVLVAMVGLVPFRATVALAVGFVKRRLRATSGA